MSKLIIDDLKKITGDVIAKYAPADVKTGVVIETNPLTVEVDQTDDYYDSAAFLIPQSLTDYQVLITVDGEDGDRLVTVKNSIQPGDSLLMLRCMGGQRILVLDKWGTPSGE